jgi:hypothetical protein
MYAPWLNDAGLSTRTADRSGAGIFADSNRRDAVKRLKPRKCRRAASAMKC